MNANLTYTIESLFGPASELIDISGFLETSSSIAHQILMNEDECAPAEVAEECSVSDIKQSLETIWDNPMLSGHLTREHDRTVTALYSLNQKLAKSHRKSNLPLSDTLAPEVAEVQKNIDAGALDSLKLTSDALLFMRTPKNSDQNVLQVLKETHTPNSPERTPNDALITISIHNRVPWGPSYMTKMSQHVFLSSNSLHDIYTAIPCISKNYPKEDGASEEDDCFLLIEGTVYGHDGENDYALKLTQHLESVTKKKPQREIQRGAKSMKDTKISDLCIRLNEPYWLVHEGNCEHFCVVDQIRRAHPSDPTTGYPLTVQITPPLLDLCRACAKVPATWSIVGDCRLGESPCPLCGPCWRTMGDPESPEGILAIPLPNYTPLSR